MSEKKLIRMFPLVCCKQWKSFVVDDFSHDNKMTLVCHRHDEPFVRYFTWKMGMDKEDFDKAAEEHKKKKAN